MIVDIQRRWRRLKTCANGRATTSPHVAVTALPVDARRKYSPATICAAGDQRARLLCRHAPDFTTIRCIRHDEPAGTIGPLALNPSLPFRLARTRTLPESNAPMRSGPENGTFAVMHTEPAGNEMEATTVRAAPRSRRTRR